MLNLTEIISTPLPSRPVQLFGEILALQGQTIRARLPQATVGDLCCIERRDGSLRAIIVGFNEREVLLAPIDSTEAIGPGMRVSSWGRPLELTIPIDPRGHVLGALGECSQLGEKVSIPLFSPPPAPLSRMPISEPLRTGIKAIDGFLTIGYGQRIGLFASAGVGKSTLLGMIARQSDVDIIVIALVGERGREVCEFLNDALGPKGRARSVVIFSTSDESPMRRALAPHTATAIAEYYRAQGKRVLLLIDSLTRVARAVREVSLAAGELPVRQGYTNTVYRELPRLLERAGNDERGSITAIYTVLTEVQADFDPLGDEIKSILDGHIALSPAIAERGIRPAIDIGSSVSRLMNKVTSPRHQNNAALVRKLIDRLKRDRDLALLGGKPDRELQIALEYETEIMDFLAQPSDAEPTESELLLDKLAETARGALNSKGA